MVVSDQTVQKQKNRPGRKMPSAAPSVVLPQARIEITSKMGNHSLPTKSAKETDGNVELASVVPGIEVL